MIAMSFRARNAEYKMYQLSCSTARAIYLVEEWSTMKSFKQAGDESTSGGSV